MQVNGNTCFTKKLTGSDKKVCGSKNGGWNEDRIKVSCTASAVNNQLTVRVYTALNSDAKDESFGIDNVVLKKTVFKTLTANFQNDKDFQGFNCVKIQNCGSYGKICGGYNTKAKGHDIKKTYKNLPNGKYTLSLDFIKIDSWFDYLDCGACTSFFLAAWVWGMRSCACVCDQVCDNVLHTAGTTRTRTCK